MWNYRMLQLTGLPQYADVMELALYNAVLPGLSLDGTQYFYQNPLADRGAHRRQEWFGCACCPPNVARLLASLSAYFYSTSREGVYVHLYAQSTAELALDDSSTIILRQQTDYPWSGDISIVIDSAPDRDVTVFLRIPFWVDEEETQLFVNGVDATDRLERDDGSYCAVTGRWKRGDTLRLVLPMPVEWIESHPCVLNNHGRVALQRGPLIYCLEQIDNPSADVWDIMLPEEAEFRMETKRIGDHEVVALTTEALSPNTDERKEALYAPYSSRDASDYGPTAVTAVPYYAWANRKEGPMLVWIPVNSDT